MDRKNVKVLADVILCSLKELEDDDNGNDVAEEQVNITLKLKSRDAIYFRDVMQVTKLLKKDSAGLIHNMLTLGLAKSHEIMRDNIEKAYKDNPSDFFEKIDIKNKTKEDVLKTIEKEIGNNKEFMKFVKEKLGL